MFDVAEYERKIYSQFTQDGITLELVRRINPHPYFLEIGAGHNGENNTHVLLDEGWKGAWIEGNLEHFLALHGYARAKKLLGQVNLLHRRATIENAAFITFWTQCPDEIGVLSIDVDGNDYWLWSALGRRAAIVIIEAQVQKPENEPYVMPYNPDYVWDGKDYESGASIFSLKELGKNLGYTYVGRPSNPHCADLFFVRNDSIDKLEAR